MGWAGGGTRPWPSSSFIRLKLSQAAITDGYYGFVLVWFRLLAADREKMIVRSEERNMMIIHTPRLGVLNYLANARYQIIFIQCVYI